MAVGLIFHNLIKHRSWEADSNNKERGKPYDIYMKIIHSQGEENSFIVRLSVNLDAVS